MKRSVCLLIAFFVLLSSQGSSDSKISYLRGQKVLIDRNGNETKMPTLEFTAEYIRGITALSSSNIKMEPGGMQTGSYSVDAYPQDICTKHEFRDGVNPLILNGTIVLIDKAGVSTKTNVSAKDVQPFSEGLAAFATRIKTSSDNGVEITDWGFIDLKGNVVVSPEFDEVLPFSDGLAAVRRGKKWGYIDKSGELVIAAKFTHAYSFEDGRAPVETWGTWSFGDFSEDRAVFIDKKGDIVLRGKFWVVRPFSEGLAAVASEDSHGKYGYMNTAGQMVIAPRYTNVGEFSEGLAPVSLEGKWGFIDREGSFVIEPKYAYADEFYNGVASVVLPEEEGTGKAEQKPLSTDRQ